MARERVLEELLQHYGEEGLYSILNRVAKLRARGVDIDGELERKIQESERGER